MGLMMITPMDCKFPKSRQDFLDWADHCGWLSVPTPHWDRYWQFITPQGELLYVEFVQHNEEWQFYSIRRVNGL